jgi:hypothetical protein
LGGKQSFPCDARCADPDMHFHGRGVLSFDLCTVRCLLRPQHYLLRCVCVSGMCPHLPQ